MKITSIRFNISDLLTDCKATQSSGFPIPEDGSCYFTIDNQWFTTVGTQWRQWQDQHGTYVNRELVRLARKAGWQEQIIGNFVHLRQL